MAKPNYNLPDFSNVDTALNNPMIDYLLGLPTQDLSQSPKLPTAAASKAVPSTGMSIGSVIGATGSALSSLVDLGITLSSKDKVAPNPFADYATATLNKLNQTESLAAKERDLQLSDLSVAQSTQQARNSQMARGISSYRGLSLATYLAGLGQQRKIEESYLGNMENIQNKEADVLLNRDRVVMGEQGIINQQIQQEKDAYRTNVAQSVANIGTTAENIGRNLNLEKRSEMAMRIAGNSGKYGTFTDYYDKLLGS